jgi:hypothetical protein
VHLGQLRDARLGPVDNHGTTPTLDADPEPAALGAGDRHDYGAGGRDTWCWRTRTAPPVRAALRWMFIYCAGIALLMAATIFRE